MIFGENWQQLFSQQLQVQTLAGNPSGYVPIPPFSYPYADGDFSLSGDAIAVDCYSISVRSTWWLGCWARIDSNLTTLPLPAISQRLPCPINRGARLIEVPQWAQSGFQIGFEVPYWIEELRIEVYLHGLA
jgi:hypothetical protein